jgi:Tfp pilus assembly protein PilF
MKKLIASCALFAWAVLLAGCATTAAQESSAAQSPEDSKASSSLYDGEPEVVFATEFPVGSAEEALARADQALRSGDQDLALYMYVRAYDLDKTNVYPLMRIAAIHEARDSSPMAARAYASVLEIEPQHGPALQALGLIYLQRKRHDEARSLLEQAIESDATLWKAYNGLGVIADLQGDYASAEAAYDAALQANPGDAKLRNNRGYSLYLQGRYDEAERDFRAAAAQGVDKAWLNLGLVLARQKLYADAVQVMARAETKEVAYNDVGYIAMRQGDYGVAERYFEKAIRVSPRYFEEARRNLDKVQEYLLAERSKSAVIADQESG